MKTSALLILSFLTVAVALAGELSRFDAEAGVRKDLRARGVAVGSDETGDSYTVLACAERDLQAGDVSAVRTVCYRMAELRARHQIMNALGMTFGGRTSVRTNPEGVARTKTVETLAETFSHQTLLGCERVASREGVFRGRYVVALALRWRRDLEAAERASVAGLRAPSAEWREAFRRLHEGKDVLLLPPTDVFVDAQGYVHRLGVGFAEPTQDHPLARAAAANFADLLARKNLQLALFGDAEMRKTAAAGLVKGAFSSTASVYEALGTVSASGTLPLGARVILERMVVHPVTRRSVYMVVYGL